MNGDPFVRELGPEDNPAILDLLRRSEDRPRQRFHVADRLYVQVDRGPDYFALRRAMGGTVCVMGVPKDDKLIGIASVVRRRVTWDQGSVESYYGGDMLVDPAYRCTRTIFRLTRAIQQQVICGGVVQSHVMESNEAARKVHAGRVGLRPLNPVDTARYLQWPVVRGLAMPAGCDVRPADDPDAGADWRACYADLQHAWNLTPVDVPSLLPGERRLIVRCGGKIVGIASVVDDIGRRLIVRGMTLKNHLYRLAVNGVALLRGVPRLPGTGYARPRSIVANLLYDRGRPDAAAALFAAARQVAIDAGHAIVQTAISDRDPLAERFSRHLSAASDRLLTVTTDLPHRSAQPALVNLHQI